jgi:hypothetical protein
LGEAQPSALSNQQAYDPFRPLLSSEPGVVPPLETRAVQELAEPRLVSAGSPDKRHGGPDVQQIVMSRDGSEGWAVGNFVGNVNWGGRGPLKLYHFSSGRWSRCDPVGIAGVLPPDPECAGIADIADGGSIAVAARVPLESDGNLSNNDDFEVVAVAQRAVGLDKSAKFIRYQNGRWAVDEQWSSEIAGLQSQALTLTFGAGEDGWLAGATPDGVGGAPAVFHLVNGNWVRCNSSTANRDCDDPAAPRLPIYGRVLAKNSSVGFVGAGERVYFFATRGTEQQNTGSGGGTTGPPLHPVVLYEDPDQRELGHPVWRQVFDPKNRSADGGVEGLLSAFSVARNPDGTYNGWGWGDFGADAGVGVVGDSDLPAGKHDLLLRLGADGNSASTFPVRGAVAEYLRPKTAPERDGGASPSGVAGTASRVVALPGSAGKGPAFAFGAAVPRFYGPALEFDPVRERWGVMETPWEMTDRPAEDPTKGTVLSMVPDGRSGAWLAVKNSYNPGTWFYRYSDRVHRPVFSDVSHPVRGAITSTAGGGDGSLWVATKSDTLFRYDRLGGWDRVPVKGWDPGVVTNPSPVHAVAIGPDGRGVAVGAGGRIADLTPGSAVLDAAAGVVCSATRPAGAAWRDRSQPSRGGGRAGRLGDRRR